MLIIDIQLIIVYFHLLTKNIHHMKRKILFIGYATLCLVSCNCGKQEQATSCVAQTDSAVVVNTIMSRRSVRQYKPEPVRRDQMEQIVACGINAPNGMNAQPWAVRVVDNPEFLNGCTELWKSTLSPEMAERMASGEGFRNMFRNAPTVVFIASPENSGQVDCGLLGENMILSAWAMGIGSCCLGSPVGFFRMPEAKPYLDKLELPEGYQLLYAIGMGYPDETPDAKPRDAGKVKFIG